MAIEKSIIGALSLAMKEKPGVYCVTSDGVVIGMTKELFANLVGKVIFEGIDTFTFLIAKENEVYPTNIESPIAKA